MNQREFKTHIPVTRTSFSYLSSWLRTAAVPAVSVELCPIILIDIVID